MPERGATAWQSEGRLRLPPLNRLCAFPAVSRHGSPRRAAEDLLFRSRAVGQHLRIKDVLQATLFQRKGSRIIAPTEAAILLTHCVNAGFAALAEGIRHATRRPQRLRLNLNASPYFAMNHLRARLAEWPDDPERNAARAGAGLLPDRAARAPAGAGSGAAASLADPSGLAGRSRRGPEALGA